MFLGLLEGFPTKKAQKSPVLRAAAIVEVSLTFVEVRGAFRCP